MRTAFGGPFDGLQPQAMDRHLWSAKGLGARQRLLQPRLMRIARFARVDDGHLAALGRVHQLPVGAGGDV